MTTARKYLDILKEREPQLWKEPLKESNFTERDQSDIEKGLGCLIKVSLVLMAGMVSWGWLC